eukprot:1760591-Pyramimonas_sp.AAC.1
MSLPHYCHVCHKSFNSEKQLLQHDQGKGHIEQLEKVRKVEEENASTNSNYYKMKLCDFFMGGCKFKEGCRFAHQLEDVTPTRPMCRYVLGYCPRGESCRFAHGLEELVCSKMEGMVVDGSKTEGLSTTPETSNKKKKYRINLYCGNCGCQQEWDDGRILEPVRNADGSYKRSLTKDGVSQGLVRFRNRGLSRCTVCENQIMRSPMSAVCVHCNSLLGDEWTPFMNCTNVRGDNPKRQLKNFALVNTSSSPCAWCVDDRPLHGAIAGKLINANPHDDDFQKGAGECYGFVMVH